MLSNVWHWKEKNRKIVKIRTADFCGLFLYRKIRL